MWDLLLLLSMSLPLTMSGLLLARAAALFAAEFVDVVCLLYLFVAALLYVCHVMGNEEFKKS